MERSTEEYSIRGDQAALGDWHCFYATDRFSEVYYVGERDVDFEPLSVSVILRNFVKTRRTKECVVCFGLLLGAMLGSFALSLAHDRIPADSIFPAVVRHGLPSGASRLINHIRQIRFDFTAGDVPPSLQKASLAARVLYATQTGADETAIRPRPYAPKIARHMLDSVLLI